MKFIIPALMTVCLSLGIPAAAAFETPAKNPSQIQALKNVGKAFEKIAADFGCPELGWAGFADPQFRVAQLEFIPAGHQVKNWTRMMTMNVYALSGDKEKDTQLLTQWMLDLVKTYKARATMLDMAYFETNNGDPAVFLEYEAGAGDLKEHNAAVFMRTSDTGAAFMRIQSRGKPLSRQDANKIYGFLGDPAERKPKVAAPVKAEKPVKKPVRKPLSDKL